MKVEVAHRSRPCRGETLSGDAVVVRSENDTHLLALIDALGHGPLAADAAGRAVEFLGVAPLSEGIRAVLEGLHHLLHGSRGAAATLCLLHPTGLEAAGVGNVGVRVFRAKASILPSPGILGERMRQLRVFRGELVRGMRLVFYSDGIRSDFSPRAATLASPEESCEAILQAHGRSDDDATVLIADLP